MNKCHALKEYAEFVEITKRCIAEGKSKNEALNLAIDSCIEHGILSEFLKTYRAEVLGMILTDFDAEKYERTLREEGRAESREQGIRILIQTLRNLGASKSVVCEQLILQYALKEDEANEKIAIYWAN